MEEYGNCTWFKGISKELLERPRKERRDAVEHRRRILEVAHQLFAMHGVEAVSMHQIALAAGIGQGTLYRRYAHKGELCLDLLQERNERLIEEVGQLFAEKRGASALERLDNVLSLLVNLLEEQGALLGPVAGMVKARMPCEEGERSDKFQQAPFHEFLYGLLSRLLAEAVEHGELTALDIPFTTDAILVTLNPLFYHFQRWERGFSQERILNGLRRIYIQGLKVESKEVDRAHLS